MTMSLDNELNPMRIFSDQDALLIAGRTEAAQARTIPESGRHLYAVPDIDLLAESLRAETSLFGGKLLLYGAAIEPERFDSGATAHYGVEGVAKGILLADKAHTAFQPKGDIELPIGGPGNVLTVQDVTALPRLAAEIDSRGKPNCLRTSMLAERVLAARPEDRAQVFAGGLQRGLRRFSWVIAGGELPTDPITVTHVDSLNSMRLG